MWIDQLAHDLRHGCRVLRKHPGLTIVAVLSLALGIGVNTMVFSFANVLLFRPLPFSAIDDLAVVREVRHDDPARGRFASYPNFRDWQDQGVSALAAMRSRSVTLADDGIPERSIAAEASWNLFPMLGIQPVRGRGFLDADDTAGAIPVVLLSASLWEQRYGADPTIIGQSISLDGLPHTVVGVVPLFTHPGLPGAWREARLWIPLASAAEADERDDRSLFVYARVNDGIEAARAELTTIADGLEARHPENEGWWVDVQPVGAVVSSTNRAMLLLTVGAVGFVLLIACSNVANLLLARATARRREFAVRLALGGSRGRLVRQLLTEGLLLALISVPLGVLIAWLGKELVRQGSEAITVAIPIDIRVLVFAIGLSVLTSLLFGLAPAREAVRGRIQDTLQHDGQAALGGRRQTRLRNVLVVSQVALSLVLLVGASLMARSFMNRLAVDEGFETAAILHMGVALSGDRYDSPDAVSRRVHEFVMRLEAVPGVESVAISDLRPLRGGGIPTTAVREGMPSEANALPVLSGGITSQFFDTLGLPLLQGRHITNAEARTGSTVAIINRAMAEALWPDGEAIGGRFQLANGLDGTWHSVVGVSRNISSWDIGSVRPTAYLPYASVAARSPSVFIRATTGDPTTLAGPAGDAIRGLDATIPVYGVRSMEAVHRSVLSRSEMMASTFTVFGIIAVLLAATGIYGVLSYLVSRRTHEVGLRMALGADRGDVVWLVVRDSLTMMLTGIAVGCLGALAMTRVARGLLYEVSAADPISLISAALLLGLVGWLASYGPARRAARVDPAVALRE